jgi:hypothetical protein
MMQVLVFLRIKQSPVIMAGAWQSESFWHHHLKSLQVDQLEELPYEQQQLQRTSSNF